MRVFAMSALRSLRFRTRPPRHLAWLLWLVLLLPIAQAATTWHTVSHTAQALTEGSSESGDFHGKRAPDLGHCALCLAAAAIHGGALPSTPIVFALSSAPHEAPAVARASVWPGLPPRIYESRAPPTPRFDR
jgi:hypothetical protein